MAFFDSFDGSPTYILVMSQSRVKLSFELERDVLKN